MGYDPNQRMISKGGELSGESPLISIDESFLLSKEKPHRGRKEAVRKDEYRLISNTSPPVAATLQDHKYDQPYLLHPQYGPTSAMTTPPSPPPQGNTLQLRPSEEDHIPQGFHRKTDICNENPIANNSTSAELTKQHAVHNQTQTQGRTVLQMDKMVSPKDLSNQNKTEDIVERNKITLGRNTLRKYGSYAKTHALKTDTPQNATKVQQTLKEKASEEIQNEKSPHKTQQVKMSKGKKAQRKEGLILPRPQLPPAPRVKAEQGDCLSSPLTKAATKTQRKPPTSSSSQPSPPTIHLNINLNTTSHLQPFQSQKGQESVINLVSLHGSPQVNPGVLIALSPRHRQSNQDKPTTMYQEGVDLDLNHWNLENIPGQWQRDYRLSALKEQLSYEEEDHEETFTAGQATQFVQHLSGTPTSTLSQSSGSYKVLPPIGRPDAETEPEVSPGPTQAAQRRVSDGYLMQMDKHKLLKTRPTYKAYSLKDYRQMKPNVTVQGLGPDYTASEKTAEKMGRQKLYSNMIRQQNKKISRIPLLPAKDPESNDKKVTRLKALEYAKTIAKPFVPVQSKTKARRPVNEAEGFSEHAPCVEGLDLSQLTTLELLRKRHEEEKQAVAQLRKIHAV